MAIAEGVKFDRSILENLCTSATGSSQSLSTSINDLDDRNVQMAFGMLCRSIGHINAN